MRTAWVISEGRSASTDYFLFPQLQKQGFSVELQQLRASPADVGMHPLPSKVVVCRYITPVWIERLAQLSREGVEIVYFMDDDLFDSRALRGLPWRYRWKIMRMALWHYKKIKDLCSQFWVSTPYLSEKYSHLAPLTLTPSALALSDVETPVRICYHGTASHVQEIAWLKSVIGAVQDQTTNTYFEIFGDARVRRNFRHIPRVSVLHAMSWPDYLSWTTIEHRDIALAPLLKGEFNAARGPTKFMDYTRLGAVGIYSDVPPYRGYVNNGVDGILLGNNAEVWVEAIMQLVSDSARRQQLASAAQRRLAEASG